MTDEERQTETETDGPETLGELSHTNPYTGEVFGNTQTYARGQTVAADGGADPEREREAEADATDEGEVLREVDHTPPKGADSANRVHARGGEATPPEDGEREVTEE